MAPLTPQRYFLVLVGVTLVAVCAARMLARCTAQQSAVSARQRAAVVCARYTVTSQDFESCYRRHGLEPPAWRP